MVAQVLLGQYSDAGVRPDQLSASDTCCFYMPVQWATPRSRWAAAVRKTSVPSPLQAALYLGVVAHYLEGSRYPVGGSGAVPRKLAAVVRAAGGACFVQARVSALTLTPAGRCAGVALEGIGGDTLTIAARDAVVSSVGALPSYQLLRPHAARLAGGPRACDAAIARLRATDVPSVAFIFLFVALDVSDQPAAERDDTSHNRWLYPSVDFTRAEKEVEASPPWSR